MLRKILGGPRYEAFIQTKPGLLLLNAYNWPRQKIRAMYGWMIGWAGTRQAEQALAGFAFAESSFFPIPPDPLLIAMTTVQPKKYLRFAVICTLFSVLGGVFGYVIGVALFETLGQWVIDTYHLQSEYLNLGSSYQSNAALAIFAAAFSPIPYKLITISAGAFRVNLAILIAVSLVGRGARFFLVAWLMHHFGRRYKDKIEQYIDLLSLVFVVLLVIGFVGVKLLF